MGKEKTKVKAHKILKKPVLAAILLMIWGFVMPMAFSVHLSNKNVQYFVIVVTGLLLYGVHKLWFRPEFKGCFCKNFGNREINKFYIIVAIVDVLLMIIGLAITGIASPTLTTLLMAIEAGVVEELAFRALPQSVMMRDWMDEKHIMFTAVFTSIIFGGIHAANAVAGADGMSTVFQVFSAFAMGMFFSAVYLRTGNILYTVIFHAVHDLSLIHI